MKTKEFINRMNELNYVVVQGTTETRVFDRPAHNTVALINEKYQNRANLGFASLSNVSFDTIVAYAKTPIEDRKEPENKHFVKDTKGEIIMTFNEAVQAMLDGKKVTWVDLTGNGYIMLNDKGNVVDDAGDLYRLYKKDFIKDWKIVNTPTVGTLLTRYGKPYRLIKETDGTYAILNTETYVEQIKGITKENLMQDLIYYDFGIVK